MKRWVLMILFSMGISLLSGKGVEPKDYLIWDADRESPVNSGPALQHAFNQNRYSGDYTTEITPYLNSLHSYCAVFVCLGYPSDHTLIYDTMAVVKAFVNYLDSGGKVYIEGGDSWTAWDDPYTQLHERFYIEGNENNGLSDPLYGSFDKISQNMLISYTEDDNWMDSTAILSPIEIHFINWPPYYIFAVSYEDLGIGYKTISAAFAFGGIVNNSYFEKPIEAKTILADSMMYYFGCSTPLTHRIFETFSIDLLEEFVFPQLTLPNPKPPTVISLTSPSPFREFVHP